MQHRRCNYFYFHRSNSFRDVQHIFKWSLVSLFLFVVCLLLFMTCAWILAPKPATCTFQFMKTQMDALPRPLLPPRVFTSPSIGGTHTRALFTFNRSSGDYASPRVGRICDLVLCSREVSGSGGSARPRPACNRPARNGYSGIQRWRIGPTLVVFSSSLRLNLFTFTSMFRVNFGRHRRRLVPIAGASSGRELLIVCVIRSKFKN